MTPNRIIHSMCLTMRHDYDLPKEKDPGGYSFPYLEGMTDSERERLWREMEQIYNNVIQPALKESFENGYFQGIEDSISSVTKLGQDQKKFLHRASVS